MFTLKLTPAFAAWLAGLQDGLTRRRLATRLRQAMLDNLGDVKVGGDVFEMREHSGRGWRMYYLRRAGVLIAMLGGGDKSTQVADIAKAITLAATIGD